MENNLCTLGSARCLCPLKIGDGPAVAGHSKASWPCQPCRTCRDAQHLPVLQTQHIGIALKVSFDTPRSKKHMSMVGLGRCSQHCPLAKAGLLRPTPGAYH